MPNQYTNKRLITYSGKTDSLRGWAKELNINYQTLRSRRRNGWNTAAMLTKIVAKKSRSPEGVQLSLLCSLAINIIRAYEVWRGDEYLGAVRKVGTHRWTHSRSWEGFYTRAKAIEALLQAQAPHLDSS